MNADTSTLAAIPAGFDDPSMESQAVFRAVLAGFSRPGRIAEVALEEAPPAPMMTGAAAIALTLFDLATPVHLAASVNTPAVRDYLTFHTGCPLTEGKTLASFAVMTAAEANDGIEAFAIGTSEYPDRSATLIIQVSAINTGGMIQLTGPGIEGRHKVSIEGVEAAFWMAQRRNQKLFPLGVDFVFVADNRLLCLPRTTNVEV